MKGWLYKETHSLYCEDEYSYSTSFFCVENAGVKLHVVQDSSEHCGESIDILGVCDGSCMPQVVLSESIEYAVKDHFSPTRVSENEFLREFIEELLVEKMITKINRWTRRYRWTRHRRLVSNFS